MGLGAGLLLVAWAPNWQIIAASQIISGFLFYSFHGVLQARATEALPEARATAVSAFAMCLFAGQTTGALVFASIMATAGYRAAFALAGFGMFAVAIWCRLRMAIR
jgi:MFS family permease